MLIISIADLVRYRSRTERLVERIAGPVRIRVSGATSPDMRTDRCSTASNTLLSWPGISPESPTCWSASTPNALQGMSSEGRSDAIAGRNCTPHSD